MNKYIYIIAVSIFICGCAHIDVDAIQICSDSLNVACAGSDRLISYDKSLINDGTIYKHVNGAKFYDLVLKIDSSTDTLDRSLEREYALIKTLNSDMQEFNKLLLKLSSDDPIDKSYAYYATSMEAHNKVLSRSFLFFANEYVMYRNFETYHDAMINNHSNIMQYSELMLEQMFMIRSDMWRKYIYICDSLGTSWNNVDKVVATKYMINLNSRMNISDTLISQLTTFYEELPLVYAELADAKRVPIQWWKRNNYEHIFRLQQIARSIKFTISGR